MRILRLALQVLIIYMAGAVILGMTKEPSFNFLHVVIMTTFFVGLFLITIVVQRLARTFGAPAAQNKRRAGVGLLLLLAALFVVVAQGVAVGVWRGPSRLAAFHSLIAHFAGAWSLVLALGVVSGILLCQAYVIGARRVA